MAAYAATVALLDCRNAVPIAPGYGFIKGTCAISNYNTTGAEITNITKYFRKQPTVITDGFSSNGYLVRWNTTDKCFHAFYPAIAHSHSLIFKANAAANAVTMAANSLRNASAGDLTVVGGGADGGIATGGAISAAAGTEVANDVDIGTINFFAIGLLPGAHG